MLMREQRTITVQGDVQGVGFSPFVYSLASRLGLVSTVQNNASGVRIGVEGDPMGLTTFRQVLMAEAPPLARSERITTRLFNITPQVVAYDLHPGYLSSQYALVSL